MDSRNARNNVSLQPGFRAAYLPKDIRLSQEAGHDVGSFMPVTALSAQLLNALCSAVRSYRQAQHWGALTGWPCTIPIQFHGQSIMTTATARESSRRRVREREADAASKSTAYGRSALRALDRMKAAGPWQFGNKQSDRYFKR